MNFDVFEGFGGGFNFFFGLGIDWICIGYGNGEFAGGGGFFGYDFCDCDE